MNLNRRDFLKISGLAGLTLFTPPALAETARGNRVLVLVELSGGNDGLNTVVPYRDPRYRSLRPNIALAGDELRTLDDDIALHPSLENLEELWQDGELAVVEGLGYPEPNRSHFRSIEIWDGATDADRYAAEGWISRVVPGDSLERFAPHAINVGAPEDGPLKGANVLGLDDPNRLFRAARGLERFDAGGSNPALAHIAKTQSEVLDAVSALETFMTRAPDLGSMFSQGPMQRPMKLVAEILASGLPLMAIKVRVGGFDTHANQPRTHARLLGVVDEALGSLRRAMKQVGRWDDLVVMTYSEFGRRARENGGAGTDHGTAAPHFVAGGLVRGGRYGQSPSLGDLDGNGDLRFTTDFRRMYSTIATRWWEIDGHELSDFRPLRFV